MDANLEWSSVQGDGRPLHQWAKLYIRLSCVSSAFTQIPHGRFHYSQYILIGNASGKGRFRMSQNPKYLPVGVSAIRWASRGQEQSTACVLSTRSGFADRNENDSISLLQAALLAGKGETDYAIHASARRLEIQRTGLVPRSHRTTRSGRSGPPARKARGWFELSLIRTAVARRSYFFAPASAGSANAT